MACGRTWANEGAGTNEFRHRALRCLPQSAEETTGERNNQPASESPAASTATGISAGPPLVIRVPKIECYQRQIRARES